MRVIKFRGFHADDNGETVIKLDGKEIRGLWLVGDLEQCGGAGWIEQQAVIPETVGQYFGENDIADKEIYEGDILRVDFEVEYVGLKPRPSYIGIVDFHDGAFGIYGQKYIDRTLNDLSVRGHQYFFQHGLLKSKVGNIYDNPELLEGAK